MSTLHTGVWLLLVWGLMHTSSPIIHGNEQMIDEMIASCMKEAKRTVTENYPDSRRKWQARVRNGTFNSGDIMTFYKRSSASNNISTAAECMSHTIYCLEENHYLSASDLSKCQLDAIYNMSGCTAQQFPKVCPKCKYRTINGECNNRKHPGLGAAGTGHRRMLPPKYDNGVSTPPGWDPNRKYNGCPLPNARHVSNKINALPTAQLVPSDKFSCLLSIYGQFADHDMMLTPSTPANCGCEKRFPCFPIMIPLDDPDFNKRNTCIPFTRADAACTPGTPVRQQVNANTPLLDLSPLYGSNQETADRLRNKTNGCLAVNQNYTDQCGRRFLPFQSEGPDSCSMTNTSHNIPCFDAGDTRNTEQMGLMMLHTLWMREHNRIALILHELNPGWCNEKVYQETKKIVTAMHQKIVFDDWLKHMVGKKCPEYKGYDECVDPSIATVITIGLRCGHAVSWPFFLRYGEDYAPLSSVPLEKTFNAAWQMIIDDGMCKFARGMMTCPAKRIDQWVSNSLREHLFQIKGLGLDLAAMNIQRECDLGIPGYIAWREYCGLSVPRNKEELAAVLNNTRLANELLETYGGCIDNLGFWLGAISEPAVKNGAVGELLHCLLLKQFCENTRNGDRFYYENKGEFTAGQLKAIKATSLSSLFCANTCIKKVPNDLFRKSDHPKDFVSCETIPYLDEEALKQWRDY